MCRSGSIFARRAGETSIILRVTLWTSCRRPRGPWPFVRGSARLEGAIWLLEQSRKDTKEKGVSQEQLENTRHGLEQVESALSRILLISPHRGGDRYLAA